MKRLTNKEFINKANQIHNFKYDYSKVNYINSKTKIIIICKKHGEFSQIPSDHLQGNGCPSCGINSTNKHNKKTNKQFIDEANKIHNGKYDYSKINYINWITKIIIICPQHGDFLQTPNNHLQKQGCPKCARKININSISKTNKEFINKANKIHNNKYDYSKTNYIKSNISVIIICSKHGEFKQMPKNHLFGSGCKKCGWANCAIKNKLNTKEFIKRSNKIHNNKYNYSKINYIGSHMKVIIICSKHGEFLQTPSDHFKGHGCQNCAKTISKGERKWLNKIEKEQGIVIERRLTIYIDGKQLKPDGFHKTTNTWYEYNGYFIHGHPDYYKPDDINYLNKKTFGELYQNTLEKEKLIKSAGYNLITKWGN